MGQNLYNSIYNYERIPDLFKQKRIDIYYQSLLIQFSQLTKGWNDDLHTQWIARHYLASKMLMSATLMLNSVKFADEKNLKVVEPYLLYYAVFSCCKSVVLTLPGLDWEDGSISKYTHQKMINIVMDTVAHFDKDYAKVFHKLLIRAKDYRELFSYSFPSSGIGGLPEEVTFSIDEAQDLCSLLAEIAQFQSERLEQSFNKNNKGATFGFSEVGFKKVIWYETEDYIFADDEDQYRIGKIVVKEKKPASLYLTMSAGMVDDFFGSWVDLDSADENVFDPDHNIRIIFDFP